MFIVIQFARFSFNIYFSNIHSLYEPKLVLLKRLQVLFRLQRSRVGIVRWKESEESAKNFLFLYRHEIEKKEKNCRNLPQIRSFLIFTQKIEKL